MAFMMRPNIAKRATVLVKFAGDEEVIENITTVNKTPSGKRKSIIYDHLTAEDVENILLEENVDDYQPSVALSVEDVDEEEQDQCTSSLSAPTEEALNGIQQRKGLRAKSVPSSPKVKAGVRPADGHSNSGKEIIREKKSMTVDSPKQPLHQRTNVFRSRQVASLAEDMDSDPEDSNDDFEDDNGEMSATSDEEFLCKELKSTQGLNRKVKTSSENYFYLQNRSKASTSNRTLSKIELPKTSIPDLQKLLKSIPEYHRQHKQLLHNFYRRMFEKWKCQLMEGFSILLYGVGSKHELLGSFCKDMLDNCLYIEVNGFYPSLSIKQLLNTVSNEVIGLEGASANMHEHVESIKEHFLTAQEDLYIVVHNIDGVVLRNQKSQSALSCLASSPKIHVIASVDHVNSSLIWDQVMLSHFRWIWYDVTTYEPYILETSYENSLLHEQSSQLVLSSLLHVFESLTPNSRGVFLMLARYQLERKDVSGYYGMTFQEWYQECRESFLVNSESTMNAQLSEFKNHKLLASKKSPDGVECWYIPVDGNTLSEFVEKESSS